MRVSGYIITKNNAKSLNWALESVYKYLDEIVIVDSGSTDDTLEIAKKYDAKIYFNEFKDFSAQRNFAISKCTGDYIFTMDADEVMGENFSQAFSYLKSKKYRAILFPRYNLISLDPCVHIKSHNHYSDWQARLFINDGKCHYIYPVHHQLTKCKPRLKVPNINIFHFHWLMNDIEARKIRGNYYDTFSQGASFSDYYIFEEYKHSVLKGIEKIEPEIMKIIKEELRPIQYEYRVNNFEQWCHELAISIKTRLAKIKYYLLLN